MELGWRLPSAADGRNMAYLLTYLLTPWNRVLLEKLTGFHGLYGTRRFITARKCVIPVVCVKLGKGMQSNTITEVYLKTVMETTTCFGLYWPSSACLGNLRAYS